MPNQLSNATKAARSAAAIEVAAEMSAQFRQAMVGTIQQVLFEQPDGDDFTGHAMNSVLVYVRASELHNQIRSVTITDVYRDGVRGVLTPPEEDG